MKQSKWIWHPGDFELYHSMRLHNRRTKFGVYYPPMWRIDAPHSNVLLYRRIDLEKPETITVYANTKDASFLVNNVRHVLGETVTLEPGRNFIKLAGYKESGFPAFYCVGDSFASDETWKIGSWGARDLPAGTNDMYTELSDNPEVFKFSYERVFPISVENVTGGKLYDFGKETFGKIILENVKPENTSCTIICGESREEALDPANAIVHLDTEVVNGSFASITVAFRYVFVPDSLENYDLFADYEYLPLEDKGAFRSDDERINKIWDVAAYTLHLNAREGFFDGIKRDRWVWGGDAYQSYFVNYYLMNDNDIVRRTQRILRGAEPMTMHINTISDYTFYWIAAIWEYYFHTGDMKFVRSIYPQMLTTMDFVLARLDADGLYEKRRGDWVFVDWSTHFDKDSGPICAEQMLLCHAYGCMAKCAALMEDHENVTKFEALASDINAKINARYWDAEKNAFIDDYKTGNRNVTRHANIFALLYDLTSEEKKAKIIEHVIKNPEIPAITTPYFEFFELDAMCHIGDYQYMTDMLHSYWGGMLDQGATTFWEEYFPEKSRVENYAMYNQPYDKSLCHAWGASPIYLLGKYALGVRPTSPAYATYEVKPNLMCFGEFEGKVPALDGIISVKMNKDSVTVLSELDGGTLVLGDKTYPIEKNKTLCVKL
ncbi:MAG: alpha-rhamnosidase [Clostridia bacterium]|nr:alpha-rhamnosidase [Clostridia bacterium]